MNEQRRVSLGTANTIFAPLLNCGWRVSLLIDDAVGAEWIEGEFGPHEDSIKFKVKVPIVQQEKK